jgi:hypothetical protein
MPTINMAGNVFEYVDFAGHKRIMGCLPSAGKAMAGHPIWEAANPVIPEADIIKFLQTQPNNIYDLGQIGSPILDQNGCGGCAGWSATGCFHLVWTLEGQTPQEFSPGYQYAQVNGGFDAGSSPIDNMNSLLKNGICLASDNPGDHIFKRQIPAAANTNAARFKLGKSYIITGWEDLISAVMLNRPVNFGMKLPRGYQSVDQRTGLPPEGGYGGLHAQFIRGLFYHPELKEIVGVNQNSWNTVFGIQQPIYGITSDLKGCCFLRQKHIFSGYFEAYAMIADTTDPNDPNPPPPAS